jgi:hypothetical protein
MKRLSCVWLVLGLLALLSSQGLAQPSSSPAFDPNIFLPTLGSSPEIDSIYGSRNGQELGGDIQSVGVKDNSGYSPVVIGGIGNPYHLTAFGTGPQFNLHKLEIVKQLPFETYHPTLHSSSYLPQKAHLRNAHQEDLVWLSSPGGNPIIYWADENGFYDTARYTRLETTSSTGFGGVGQLDPYIDHFTSDSVEDVIIAGTELHIDNLHTPDSVYLYLYHGGDALFNKGHYALPDQQAFVDTLYRHIKSGFNCGRIPGDFRGVGRKDLIITEQGGNVCYYRNDLPFSLENLASSFFKDTLFYASENGQGHISSNYLCMQAFPKKAWDKSNDLVIQGIQDTTLASQIYIFRGGSDFGSKKMTMNSAEQIIPPPKQYDSYFDHVTFSAPMTNCGDMTGTGNPVLLVQAGLDGGFYAYYFFYVLGKATDDKIDMCFEVDPYGDAIVDTLTADSDGLQDILLGLSRYYSYDDLDKGKTDVGTVILLHGNTKIPVHLNPKYTILSSGLQPHLTVYPNPAVDKLIIESSTESIRTVVIRDILGRQVFRTSRTISSGPEQIIIPVHNFIAGNYLLTVENASGVYTEKFSIIH